MNFIQMENWVMRSQALLQWEACLVLKSNLLSHVWRSSQIRLLWRSLKTHLKVRMYCESCIPDSLSLLCFFAYWIPRSAEKFDKSSPFDQEHFWMTFPRGIGRCRNLWIPYSTSLLSLFRPAFYYLVNLIGYLNNRIVSCLLF